MKMKVEGLALIFFLTCITSLAPVNLLAQQKPEEGVPEHTFKVRTELLEVHAVVTDREGRVVEGLTKEDFELFDENKPQEISFFSVSRVDVPQKPRPSIRAPQIQPAAPGRLQEQLVDSPARSTVLYVDNLHLSFTSLNWVKQAVRRFVNEQMTAQDAVALIPSSGSLGLAQQFTRDKQVLRYGIERINLGPILQESRFTPHIAARVLLGDRPAMELAVSVLTAELGLEVTNSMAEVYAMQVLSEASSLRESTLQTLKAIVDQMIRMPGQRMIVILSDGFTQHGRDGAPKTDDVRAVINRAVLSGIVVYSIDAKGLTGPVMEDDTFGYFNASEHEKLDGMSMLAHETGGELYMNTNNITGAIGEAIDANRFYYVLAYYLKPDSDKRPLHSIRVRVRDHPEYNVRALRNYSPAASTKMQEELARIEEMEERQTPQQRLARAMLAPLPNTNLGVSARMDFVETGADYQQVLLTITFDGDKFQYKRQDQNHTFNVEILYFIYDTAGKQVETVSNEVQGVLTPERLALGQTFGYVYSRQLKLKPGIYQARVGVREIGTDRFGTASAWAEVPNLERSKLELSSLVLLDPPRAAPTTVKEGKEELKRIKTIQGIRLYPRNDAVGYFFRVYRNADTPIGSDLTLKTELLKDGQPVRQSRWMPLASGKRDIGGGKEQIYVGSKVNLDGLATGMYELSISVRDARSKKTAHRTAVFGIED